MDYAIMDATIAKLDKKPPLWISRQNLIMEIDDLTNDCIAQSFSGSSRYFVYRDLCENKNKSEYRDHLTTSPFWRLRMGDRAWDGDYLKFDDVNEKVHYDYYNALYEGDMLYGAQISMLKEFSKKNESETRNNIRRAIQQEVMLGLYGKICDDILNEILLFC